MKKIYILAIVLFTISLTSFSQNIVSDSVFMGSSYRNEVYYKLSAGMIDTVPVRNWDLAFSVIGTFDAQFYAILANHSNGVVISKYPKGDIESWANFDTIGKSTWRVLWNTDTSWSYGAFNRNADAHPIYSWGIYTASGEITGDSLYLVTMGTGTSTTFKKLWIIQRKSSSGVRTWNFRYANLDGSADTTITLNDADYTNKYFAYYSLRNNVALNREPNRNAWDIVFTRYFASQNVPGIPYYQVTGVLHNRTVKAIKATGAPITQIPNADSNDTRFNTNISTIGWDWKNVDAQFRFFIEDSTAYFIKVDSALGNDRINSKIYKLVFTQFAGQSTGRIVFDKQLVADFTTTTTSVINSVFTPINVAVYPNPANNQVTVLFDTDKASVIRVVDITGKEMYQQIANATGFQQHIIPVNQLVKGIYFIEITTDESRGVQKLVVN
jgi:hypothetical protein